MMRRWRIFDEVDDGALDALQKAEEELDVEHVFTQAIKRAISTEPAWW